MTLLAQTTPSRKGRTRNGHPQDTVGPAPTCKAIKKKKSKKPKASKEAVEEAAQPEKVEVGFSIDERPQQQVEENRQHQFQVVDQEKVFYSESRHLKEKAERIEAESRKEKEKEEEEGENREEEKKERGFSRYFLINQDILCHRCKQPGHMVKNCIEEPVEEVELCLFCMEPHRRFECYNQICFNCQQLGHQSRECPYQNGPPIAGSKCYSCNKRGHQRRDCQVLQYMNVLNDNRSNIDSIMRSPPDTRLLCCIACGMPGHLHCQLMRVPYGDSLFQTNPLPITYVPDTPYQPPHFNQPSYQDYQRLPSRDYYRDKPQRHHGHSYRQEHYPREREYPREYREREHRGRERERERDYYREYPRERDREREYFREGAYQGYQHSRNYY